MVDEMLLNSLKEQSQDCIVNDRRKGPDFLLTLVNVFNYLIWAILLIVMAVCEKIGLSWANYNYITLEEMNLGFVSIAIKFTAILFIISSILILLSFKRCRRRNDKIKTSIFIGEIISFGIWMYLVTKMYF